MSTTTPVLRPVVRAVAVAVAVLTALVVAGAPLAYAGARTRHHRQHHKVRLSQYDRRLLRDINRARRAHHRRPLRLAAGTTVVAHVWSCRMARRDRLAHRPDLVRAIVRHGSRDWGVVGENVGMSGDANPDTLFEAYMHSPEHRANILDRDYRFIGIHTSRGHRFVWNTLDFVDAYNGHYRPHRVAC